MTWSVFSGVFTGQKRPRQYHAGVDWQLHNTKGWEAPRTGCEPQVGLWNDYATGQGRKAPWEGGHLLCVSKDERELVSWSKWGHSWQKRGVKAQYGVEVVSINLSHIRLQVFSHFLYIKWWFHIVTPHGSACLPQWSVGNKKTEWKGGWKVRVGPDWPASQFNGKEFQPDTVDSREPCEALKQVESESFLL